MTVNICSFSSNKKYLTTGRDDCKKTKIASILPHFGSIKEKISWSNYKILGGHSGDVYDLSWTPDSKYLNSGNVDNYCKIQSVIFHKKANNDNSVSELLDLNNLMVFVI